MKKRFCIKTKEICGRFFVKKGIIALVNVCIAMCCVWLSGCKKSDELLMKNDAGSAFEESINGSNTADGTQGDGQSDSEAEIQIVVHIVGAVNKPGVYVLPIGSRVADVIKMAGGYTEEASTSWLNQARMPEDGEQIYVPTQKEVEQWLESGETDFPTESRNSDGDAKQDTKVNINKATVEELMNLPGIGESKARSIVDFREQNGKFASIEELMMVPGIKEGIYNQIKDFIQV